MDAVEQVRVQCTKTRLPQILGELVRGRKNSLDCGAICCDSGLAYSVVESTTLFDAPRESSHVTVTVTSDVVGQAIFKV